MKYLNRFIIIIKGLLVSHLLSAQNELNIGEKVPDFEVQNVINYSKKSLRISEFKGKAVIIDFWGTSCRPCIKTLFKLDSLQKKYKDKIQVIAVTDFDTKEKVEIGRAHV